MTTKEEALESKIEKAGKKLEAPTTQQHLRSYNAFPRLARFLERWIFYGTMVVIALTAIPYGTVQPWWVSLFECLVFALAIMAIFEGYVGPRRPLNWILAAPLVVLALFAIIQTLPLFSGAGLITSRSLSADPYSTRQFALRLFAFVVISLLLLRYCSSMRRLNQLTWLVVGIGVVSACFGLARGYSQTQAGLVLPALTEGRGFGQFINRNHFAYLMEMSFGLSVGLIATGGRRYPKVFVLIIASVLTWVALIYSGSRGGIIASLCQLLFLAFVLDPIRYFRKQSFDASKFQFRSTANAIVIRIILVACLVILFVIGVAWIGGEQVITKLESVSRQLDETPLESRENTRRKEIWSTTWQLIKARPVAGVGFGAYWIGITRYHDASGEFTPQEAHNDYLELLASGGIIGAALVTWFIVAFVRKALGPLHSPHVYRRAASMGALTGLFGVAVHSFVDFGLHITINALIFCVLIVIATAEVAELDALPEDTVRAGRFVRVDN